MKKIFEGSEGPLTPEEEELAFLLWSSRHKEFGTKNRKSLLIKDVRIALQLTRCEVAKRLGISQQSVGDLEAAHQKGTISINNLKRVFEAMDCHLSYSVSHKSTKEFNKLLWDKLLEGAGAEQKLLKHSKNFRPFVLSGLVEKRFLDGKLRKKLSWTNRRSRG